LLIFNDSFIAIVYGINKALAKQADLLLTIFVPIVLMGVPFAYVLCFYTSMSISGLYLGLFFGVCVSNIWNAYLVWGKYDWGEISKNIKEKAIENKLKEEGQEKETLINS